MISKKINSHYQKSHNHCLFILQDMGNIIFNLGGIHILKFDKDKHLLLKILKIFFLIYNFLKDFQKYF